MTDATHPFDALMEITARPPVVFVRGAGSYLCLLYTSDAADE